MRQTHVMMVRGGEVVGGDGYVEGRDVAVFVRDDGDPRVTLARLVEAAQKALEIQGVPDAVENRS